MKIRLFIILGLSFVLSIGGSKIAWAQEESASSTDMIATSTAVSASSTMESAPAATTTATAAFANPSSTAKITTPTATMVINSGYGLPEWHQGEQQSFIWRGADAIIRRGVSQLAIEPQQFLPMPVLFGIAPSKLAQNFGDARGSGRLHEGLDIVAPKGAPIVSPTPAVVLSAGFGISSGYYVTTANPGDETFVYMHLDRQAQLTAGQVIRAGDLIGYAGNTGNAAGGGAHLHFEIRKFGATNPFSRLKSEFTLAQKISFLANILTECTDKNTLANFLVNTYPAEFTAAQAANIAMPAAIVAQMAPAAAPIAGGAPASGLFVGSRGTSVVTLQNFLITQNKGPAAISLARTGATGYFGLLTRDALTEYNAATTTAPAKMTAAQIKAKIAEIQALIISLQKQLLEMQSQAT